MNPNVPPPAQLSQPPSSAEALRSVHTSNLPEILEQLQISLAVSTYQAGKVILVRADGATLNTHFRSFGKPMGIAADRSRLTIGGTNTVWYYRNLPAVAPKLEPRGRHDACYLPRRIHVTGDIDIHEMDYDRDDALWVVNTRFGCLCTLDAEHSFYPRWRPPFISAYAPEDRCHLNGLAMVDGRPKYVTALGETDTAGGWRANKRNGGILMDIETNAILLRGLSMPHSPRWYQGKLWLLESGQGSLAVADLKQGTWRAVAQLPGYTRGLDFLGPLAFIGLSQVRESATFSGIPLVERLRERTCGVWVVHLETGETLGFLRFEAGVQEIFAVQVLPGMRFPEILEWDDARLGHSYVLPDEALAQVFLPSEEELRRSPAFHFQQGLEHYREGRLRETIAAYRQCLALDPIFPNARYNLGVALGDAEDYAEGFTSMQLAAEAEPERAEIWNSMGYLACQERRPREAVSYYQRAIELQPDYAQAHFNLGMTLLQLGDYRRGLAEHEWRCKTERFTPLHCPHPRWDGSPIPGQTLLIPTEQGAGDAIQFARYLPLAAERVGRLIVVCTSDLSALFATLPGIAEIREPGTLQLTEFDTYLPLLSLPYVFGTTLETIPAELPYLDVALLRRRKTVTLPTLIPGEGTGEVIHSI
ncbi:MAG: TIGR03032 family protein, partial [Terriglobales bacterium]